MTWWVLTNGLPAATLNSLTLRAFTNIADHLFASWAYHKPARHPIYRTVRGLTVRCGYKYIWDTPNVAEQIQTGDTTYHTFNLTNLTHNSTIWYYIWAPDGPYGRQIQGPLQHYTLPVPPLWPRKHYVATRLKGVYYTRSLKGPGEPQPSWIRLNEGLHSLKFWQLTRDLLAPAHRMYALVGDVGDRILYRLEPPDPPWWLPNWPSLWPPWQPMLTNAEACTLTGSPGGELCWVATNYRHPGHVYVLFNSDMTTNGIWHIRSLDYGATWNAFQIYAGAANYRAGNIMAGITKGLSGFPSGHVLYATTCTGLYMVPGLWMSSDLGQTWTYKDGGFLNPITPRCNVDPTDQSIVYFGMARDSAHPVELWRSIQHGANLLEVDGDHSLGFNIAPLWGNNSIHDTDHHWLTVIRNRQLWTTLDYCRTWVEHPTMPWGIDLLDIISHSPENIYLARYASAPAPGYGPSQHVLYLTDNYGRDLWGVCGDHCADPTGGGDSIPYNCGGMALDGILHPFPSEQEFWE